MKIKANVAISDSGFLFNPGNGESFSVNPIGKEVINLLKEGKAYPDIAKHVLERYQTDEATFEKDFQDFTGFLTQHQLVDNNGQTPA